MLFSDRNGNQVIKPENRTVKIRRSSYGIYFLNDSVLLVKPQWSEKYELPGGAIEINESPEEGLIREFYEETGCKIIYYEKVPLKVINQNFYADDVDEYFNSTMTFFKINQVEGKLEILHPDEIKELGYVFIKNLNQINCKLQILELLISANSNKFS